MLKTCEFSVDGRWIFQQGFGGVSYEQGYKQVINR